MHVHVNHNDKCMYCQTAEQMPSSTIQYFSTSVRPNVYVIYNSCLHVGTIIIIDIHVQDIQQLLLNILNVNIKEQGTF